MDRLKEFFRAQQIVAGLGPAIGISVDVAQEQSRSCAPSPSGMSAKRKADGALGPVEGLAVVALQSALLPAAAGEQSAEPDQQAAKKTRAPRKPKLANPTNTAERIGDETKRALTVNEAVRLYSISRSSLYLLIKAGKLPDIVVAGRRLLPRDAMEALIAGSRS